MSRTENDGASPLLSNTVYDQLKFVAQILLPGVGALYFALAQIWGLPKPEEVVGTIAAIDAFLGLFLAKASRSYENSGAAFDGAMNVDYGPQGQKLFNLDLHDSPEKLENKKSIRFKVNPR